MHRIRELSTLLPRLVACLALFALCAVSPASSATVTKLFGGQINCDSALASCFPIPLTPSFLCNGTGVVLDCPQYFSPYWPGNGQTFYGLTNRTNPPRCVKSTDGGATWGLCPSNPFAAAIGGLGASFAVAQDGSLISGAAQGVNNCIIRRSTDQGNTWSTVFTDVTANVTCAISFASPTPNEAQCSRSAPYCVQVYRVQATGHLKMVYSTNNGLTWSLGSDLALISSDSEYGLALSDDGTKGTLNGYAVTYNQVLQPFAYTTGGDWSVTGPVPLPPGAGPATRCSHGSMIFNGGQAVLCGPDNIATTTYRLFTHAGGVVSLSKSVIPQNGLSVSNAPDILAVGFGPATGYLIGKDTTATKVQINVTTDSFTSLPLIGQLAPASALIAGCCRGDIYSYAGKIYFSSGAVGANAFLMVIQ